MRKSFFWIVAALMFVVLRAAEAQDSSAAFYTVGSYDSKPIKSVYSRTLIKDGTSITHMTYRVANKEMEVSEVDMNLNLPPNMVLTGFGYYYKDRFIRGKMYDKGDAWKIYTAVTSRGRDPGIMDRPSEQEYHAQIYPVEPGKDVRVVVEYSGALSHEAGDSQFELPLTSSGNQGDAPVKVDSIVRIPGVSTHDIVSPGDDAAMQMDGSTCVLHHEVTAQEPQDWNITIRSRRHSTPAVTAYSAMSGRDGGYYALFVDTGNRNPGPVRVTGASMRGPAIAMCVDGGVYVFGRYRRAGELTVRARRAHGCRAFTVRARTSPGWVDEKRNVAAKLWADKEIASLQYAANPHCRAQVVRLSERFNVVSDYTALLAIPSEVLDYYKRVLAKRQIQTNTQTVGGGGGDPYIAVKAPADAQQVVAVLPDGEIKDLAFDISRQAWTGRFDLPLDAPAGEFRVTVIVVHHDGRRTRFVLVYDNRQTGPTLQRADSLTASPGGTVPIRVEGLDIARAVAVAPWGERIELSRADNAWTGSLTVPGTWNAGVDQVHVILLDGAHNRTEITLDLTVRKRDV